MATSRLDTLATISSFLRDTPPTSPIASSPKSKRPRVVTRNAAKRGRYFVVTSAIGDGVVFVKVVIADSKLAVAQDLLEHSSKYEHLLSFCPSAELRNVREMSPAQLLKSITRTKIVHGDQESQIEIREFGCDDVINLDPKTIRLFVLTASLSDGIKHLALIRSENLGNVIRDIIATPARYKELFLIWPLGAQLIAAGATPERLLRIITLTHESDDPITPRIELHEFHEGDVIALAELESP
eukprot:TRINITY_DN13059_c0_g1_i1.p1 TRINITY_DN13059_c0_g1~~TRINITY_DN13059_c0_g1_i1.p1  ORF type:complete len:253 (+),score=40.43 TRINITY_DN13059_c0_g1_i1:38-760(+)